MSLESVAWAGPFSFQAWLETLPVAPFKHARLTDIRGIFPFLFFKIFFLMWTIFKVFTEFVTKLLLFYLLFFWLRGKWDLNSRSGIELALCTRRQSLKHWIAREVPFFFSFIYFKLMYLLLFYLFF